MEYNLDTFLTNCREHLGWDKLTEERFILFANEHRAITSDASGKKIIKLSFRSVGQAEIIREFLRQEGRRGK